MSTKSQDGVYQGNDLLPCIFQFLQAVLSDDVDGTARVDKNSPYNGASHLYFHHQGIIVRGGEAWAFCSTEHHWGHCISAALLSRENLLGPSKLSFLGGLSDAFYVSTGDSGHYLCGAFFVSRLGSRGLAFLLKETRASLQKPVDLTLVWQLLRGLPQLPTLSECVPILLIELTILPRIVGFWY